MTISEGGSLGLGVNFDLESVDLESVDLESVDLESVDLESAEGVLVGCGEVAMGVLEHAAKYIERTRALGV